MKLTNPTNAELNAAFATEICGYKFLHAEHRFDNGVHMAVDGIAKPDGQWLSQVPDFCSDANAVLVWLEKDGWHSWNLFTGGDRTKPLGVVVQVLHGSDEWVSSVGPRESFSKAAVIALLRANGVEIVMQ